MNGWIKLHRDIRNETIASKLDLFGLYVHLLCRVNFEANEFFLGNQRISLEPWQGVISLKSLADEFQTSIRKIKKMLQILENEKKLKTKCTNKYTIVTIVSRSTMQTEQKQTENKPKTNQNENETNKKDKKEKKNKKEKKINNKSTIVDWNEIVSESTKNIEAWESGNLQIQNPPPTPSLSWGFGNPDIDAILGVILKYNDGVIDGSNVQNRRHAKTLMTKIQKFSSVQEGKTSVTQFLETLCSIVSQDKYFAHYLSSPYSIYTNLATLTQRAKSMYHEWVEKSKKQQAQTVDFGSI